MTVLGPPESTKVTALRLRPGRQTRGSLLRPRKRRSPSPRERRSQTPRKRRSLLATPSTATIP